MFRPTLKMYFRTESIESHVYKVSEHISDTLNKTGATLAHCQIAESKQLDTEQTWLQHLYTCTIYDILMAASINITVWSLLQCSLVLITQTTRRHISEDHNLIIFLVKITPSHKVSFLN
jgi:hypothetical protein